MGMSWIGYRRDPDEALRILGDEEMLDELLESDLDDSAVDLDKAWDGIHWLLRRASEITPVAAPDALFGGNEVGDDLGYGPARLLPVARVTDVADALRAIDADALGKLMDPAAMNRDEVYPSIWDETDVFDTYLAPNYEGLRSFYARAAEAGEAVIQLLI